MINEILKMPQYSLNIVGSENPFKIIKQLLF